MPTAICKTCSRLTNSALSEYWNTDTSKNKIIGEVTKCYATWNEEEEKWTKGCAYEKLGESWYKRWVDRIIEGGKS